MGIVFLLGIVVAWALTIPLLSSLTQTHSSEQIVFLRFVISCVFMLPFAKFNRKDIINGMIMGIIGVTAYILQALGLESGDVTNGSLIIVLPVVVVPLLSTIFFGEKVSTKEILAAAVCFIGILVSFGFQIANFSTADTMTTIAMLINSFYMIVIAKRSGENVYSFAFWQILTCTIASFLVCLVSPREFSIQVNTEIIFLALGATLFPIIAQPLAQKKISATIASIVFSLELVLALVFNFLYLSVLPNTNQMIGAGLICLAFVASIVKKK